MPSLVTLTTFDNSLEAHILRGLLESENVPVFLLGEHFFSCQSLLNVGLSHIRLQVPAQQLAEAKQILINFRQGYFEQPLVEKFKLKSLACEKCGCNETQQALSHLSLATNTILAFCFIGLAMPAKKFTVCKKCKSKITE